MNMATQNQLAKQEWKAQHRHPPGFRARRGLNWFTVGLLYAMYYMCRYNFRFAGPGMREEFGWGPQQIADLAGWFSLAYGTGQLVNGLFCDRIGDRTSMLIGAVGTIVLNLVIGFTPAISTFSVFAALWMLNGYIQAAGVPGMVKINAAWFNRDERGVFSGIFGFMIQSGQMTISLLAPLILNGFAFLAFAVGPGQWRMLFTLPPMAVALVALVYYSSPPPAPTKPAIRAPSTTTSTTPPAPPCRSGMRSSTSSPTRWSGSTPSPTAAPAPSATPPTSSRRCISRTFWAST